MRKIIEAPGDTGAPEGMYSDLDALIAKLKVAAGLANEPKINTILVSTANGIEEVEPETGLARR